MIKREKYSALQKHLSKKEITLIVGSRQVGKSTLMELLREDLQKKGEKTVFFSLDFDQNKSYFASQSNLIQAIRLQIGNNKGYVFLDEIQRKENAGLFLKGLYDMHLPYKFIVSGSGSLELKEKIHESLAGRKQIFEIDTLSFKEFVNFKTDYRYEDKLSDFFTVEKDQARSLLEEYMLFGGYPRVILEETLEGKRSVLEEIYQSYLEKDLKDLLHLEKTEAFTNLVRILASQIGGMVNITELTSTVGIANKTIQKYLYYLEKTFILKKITPFFKNVRTEITKAPIYYFLDLGLRNYILGTFGLQLLPTDSGHLFENFVFNILREQKTFASTSIHFWRTMDKAEVDFILQKGKQQIPFEVKFTVLKKPEILRSFRNFIIKYMPEQAYIVHLGEKQAITINLTKINFIPYYQLLFLEL